jgi:hypothetical protein
MARKAQTRKKAGAGAGAGAGSGGAAAAAAAAVPAAVAVAIAVPIAVERAEHEREREREHEHEQAHVAAGAEGGREDDEKTEEKCPACSNDNDDGPTEGAGEKETWIQCDACRTWFHWNCAGHGGDAQQLDKWYAPLSLFQFLLFLLFTLVVVFVFLSFLFSIFNFHFLFSPFFPPFFFFFFGKERKTDLFTKLVNLFVCPRFCASCMAKDPSRMVTLKPVPTRKSSRKSSAKAVQVPADPDPGGDTPMLDASSSASVGVGASAGASASASAGVGAGASGIPTAAPTQAAPPAPAPAPPTPAAATSMPHDLNKWITVAQSKPYSPDTFRRMKGYEVGQEWIYADPNAMTEPVVIDLPEGLGMKMPPKEYTVRDVAADVGPDTPLEVIGASLESSSRVPGIELFRPFFFFEDVLSQSTSPNWTLGKWAEYYHSPATERDKIRNVISLEVTGTPLGVKILPPRLVREIDWVEKFWPHNKKLPGQYPKVQLYCLMSVAQSWTVSERHFGNESELI